MKNFVFVGLLVLVGVVSFWVGHTRATAKYQGEYSRGYKSAESKLNSQIDAMGANGFEADRLRSDYNKLVDDYNKLRAEAINYVNANVYQPRQPITCSSYDYGFSSTSTTCY